MLLSLDTGHNKKYKGFGITVKKTMVHLSEYLEGVGCAVPSKFLRRLWIFGRNYIFVFFFFGGTVSINPASFNPLNEGKME